MARGFDWRELALVLAGLAVLGAVSWGLVVWLSPRPASAPSQPSGGWETAVKDLVRGHLELSLNAAVIEKPRIKAALEAIAARLTGALNEPLPYPLDIVVVDNPEANAVTFPGGLVVVYRGLLEDATAEETAAVLAHELGHVAHHDSADLLVKTLFVTSIAALTTSSEAVLQIIQTLSQNAFSRDIEDRADRFALDLLARARISPARLGDFLAARKDSPAGEFVRKNMPYLLDHPETAQRVEQARRAPFTGPEEPLDLDWAAVREELRRR